MDYASLVIMESWFTQEKINDKTIAISEYQHFEIILSIGELEENQIGSNCGQYLETLMER